MFHYVYQFSIMRTIHCNLLRSRVSIIHAAIKQHCWFDLKWNTGKQEKTPYGNGIPITVKRMTPRLTRDICFSLILQHLFRALALRNIFNLCFIEQQRFVKRTVHHFQYQSQPRKIVHQSKCLWFVYN